MTHTKQPPEIPGRFTTRAKLAAIRLHVLVMRHLLIFFRKGFVP